MSTTAKKPAPSSTKSDAPDAVKLLTADHKEVHALFAQYNKLCEAQAPADDRQPVAEKICGLLTVHATVEEEIFYPAAREAGVESALLDEAEVEHATAKDLIAQLQSTDAGDELYDAKVTVLGEYIDHHVKEEQDEIFPACRQAKMDFAGLGAEINSRKTELMGELVAEAKPKQDPITPKNQGEGDRGAARRYNDDQKRFVESGGVADAARRAKPETDIEADDLLDAEQQGRNKAKGEDPTVPGANAKSRIKVGHRV